MARCFIVAFVILVSSIDFSKPMTNSINVAILLDVQGWNNTGQHPWEDFKTMFGGDRNIIEPFLFVFENAKNRSMKRRLQVTGIFTYVFKIDDNGTMDGVRYITYLNDYDSTSKMSSMKSHMLKLATNSEAKAKWRRRTDLLEADDTKKMQEFKFIMEEGAPVVPILIRRVASKDAVKDYVEKIRVEEENHGYLIVTDSYKKPGFVNAFDLTLGKKILDESPRSTLTEDKRPYFDHEYVELTYNIIWPHIRERLETCPYEPVHVEGECFWYHMEACRKRVARITNSSVAQFPKYCLRGYHYRRDCEKSVCEKFCEKFEGWSKCDAKCGWGMTRQIITDYSVSPLLRNCKADLNPDLKHCYVECYGSHLMIAGGVLLLLAILGALAVGWSLWPTKRSKKKRRGGWSQYD